MTTFNKNPKENEGVINDLIESMNLTKELTCKNFKEFRKKFDELYQKELNIEMAKKIYM